MQSDRFRFEHFPKSLKEFNSLFEGESSSLHFLFSKRWPNGFQCSYCGWINQNQLPAKNMTCSHCGHPTSVTTNTIMHGTKKSLSQWLTSIWWLTATDGGHSAKDLQRLLNLPSYQTAWTWLQKLRMAMAAADNKPCHGTVELSSDTIYFGADSSIEATILAAAEIIMPAGITGRIKMRAINSLDRESLKQFLDEHIVAGSSLIIPNLNAYHTIDRKKYITVKSDDPFRSRELLKSFEIWLNRVHRGSVAVKHLQLYLDEFCFRRNTEMLSNKESVFNLLLAGVISRKPPSYKNITAKPIED